MYDQSNAGYEKGFSLAYENSLIFRERVTKKKRVSRLIFEQSYFGIWKLFLSEFASVLTRFEQTRSGRSFEYKCDPFSFRRGRRRNALFISYYYLFSDTQLGVFQERIDQTL